MTTLLRDRLLIALCLLLVSCSEPAVIEGLDSDDSLQLLSELVERGVQADRSKSSGDSYSVIVPQERFAEALKITKKIKGRDRATDEILKNFVSSTSLLPQSKAAARLKAETVRSLQIERALSNLQGVELAKVFFVDNEYGAVVTHYEDFNESDVRKILSVASNVDSGDVLLTLQKVSKVESVPQVGEEVLSLKRVAPFSFSVPNHQKKSTSTELLAFFFIASSLSLTVGVLTGVILQRRKLGKAK